MIDLPRYYDFVELRRTPAQVRAQLEKMGHSNIVAFQTRNPMHRIHEELTKRAAEEVDGSLLIHPVVGMTKPGDVDHYTRVRVYRALVENYYDKSRTLLSPAAPGNAHGWPSEALWHAIIRRNFGANHFIIGAIMPARAMTATASPSTGLTKPRRCSSSTAKSWASTRCPSKSWFTWQTKSATRKSTKSPKTPTSSRSLARRYAKTYLAKGNPLPEWFTRKETADILQQMYPPRHMQGFCIWFTGLSGSGKSTTAEVLTSLLLERGRQVTLLDGDVVRTHLSKGLGFSREDRDTNILRIGFVASEIARYGGAVITAAISPYRVTRNEVRKMVGDDRFIEVFVDTPIELCEQRDVKGLYARARRGQITGFTGVDDPYEVPVNPEITLYTVGTTPEENARKIISYLEEHGFLQMPEPKNGHNGHNGHNGSNGHEAENVEPTEVAVSVN